MNPGYVDLEVIVLTREGIWLADGEEISHEPTRRLFARSVVRRADGWYLVIGRETKKIEVEDTAFFVQRLDGDPARGFTVLLSDQTEERLDPSTLVYRPGRLVCRIHDGRDEAKFLSAPYHDLLKNLQQSGEAYVLKIEGKTVRLS